MSNTSSITRMATLSMFGVFISSVIGTAVAAEATADMNVLINVQASCVLDVNDMDFGTVTIGDSNITANAVATVKCTNGQEYVLTADRTSDYLMKAVATGVTSQIAYDLYEDSTYTTHLKDSVLSRTGNGTDQTITIYGKVPSVDGATSGQHKDTITLTVTY